MDELGKEKVFHCMKKGNKKHLTQILTLEIVTTVIVQLEFNGSNAPGVLDERRAGMDAVTRL